MKTAGGGRSDGRRPFPFERPISFVESKRQRRRAYSPDRGVSNLEPARAEDRFTHAFSSPTWAPWPRKAWGLFLVGTRPAPPASGRGRAIRHKRRAASTEVV